MKLINELDLNNKIVLMNIDLNIDINNKVLVNKKFNDLLESIKYCLNQKAKVILFNHLLEAKKQPKSIKAMAQQLCNFLDKDIYLSKFSYGEAIDYAINKMNDEDILILELQKDEKKDEAFAKYWIDKADVFINESLISFNDNDEAINDLSQYTKQVGVGFYVNKNLDALHALHEIKNVEPNHLVTIFSADIDDQKIKDLEALIKCSSKVLIGGKIASTFLKAKEIETGNSYVNQKYLDQIKDLLKTYKDKIILPIDFYCYKNKDYKNPELQQNKISSSYNFLDIGKATFELFTNELKEATHVIWDGMLATRKEALAGSFQLFKVLTNIDNLKLYICDSELVELFVNLKKQNLCKVITNHDLIVFNLFINGSTKLLDLMKK